MAQGGTGRWLGTTLWLLLWCCAVAAATPERGLRVVSTYLTGDLGGGPQNFCVTQDHRGILYAGNLAGVLEFDGVWWRVIPLPNDSAARALACDVQGRVAVGGFNEFGFLAPDSLGAMRYESLLPQLPGPLRSFGEVWRAHATSAGTFFLTDRRVLLWDGSAVKVLRELSEGARAKSAFVVGDTYYLWDAGGLYTYSEGAFVRAPGGARFAGHRVALLLPAGGGSLLVAADGLGVKVYGGPTSKPLAPDAERWLAGREVVSGCVLADGRLAVVTRGDGVLLLDRSEGADELLDDRTGVPVDEVASAYAGRDGALWLALESGLLRVDASSPLSLIGPRSGLRGTPLSLARHQGTLYVGTNSGLFVLARESGGADGDPWAPTVARPVPGVEGAIWSLQDAGDDLLAGAEGVFVVKGGRALPITATAGITVYAMAPSPEDPSRVILGLRQGLGGLRREGGGWRFEGLAPGVSTFARSLVTEPDGRLWLGTVFDGAQTLPHDPWVVPGGQPQRFGSGEIHIQKIGTRAVLMWKHRIWAYDLKTGQLGPDPLFGALPPLDHFFLASEDRAGNLWTNARPPAVVRRNAKGALMVDTGSLASSPGHDVRCILCESAGNVWLGTEKGLLLYSPAPAQIPVAPPPPLIRRVSSGPTGLLYGGAGPVDLRPVRLPAGSVRLHIEWAPADAAPGVRYQYVLEPGAEGWSDWTEEPFVDFTNLWEGDYTFRVRMRGVNGEVSPAAAYSFTVSPPWFRTWPAYAAYLVLLASVVWASIRLRLRSLRRRTVLLEARVAAQTQELARTVDELRLAKLEVEQKNELLEEANVGLKSLSARDGLTGIPNRRSLEEALRSEWDRARRSGAPLAVALLDLDHFKDLNDAAGHLAGDDCLRQVAGYLQGALRRSADTVARFGGEEFALVLPATDLEGARRVAEDLRRGLEALSLPHPTAAEGVVTLSAGVAATRPSEGGTLEDLLGAADRALYRAKAEGRNTVRWE
jgi:diguanylate cyclase (GGDEF)-like protein